MFAATVLAAGASRRMGRPKPLLEYAGRTFLQTILDTTASLGLHTVVAVGHDSDKLLAQHDLRDVTVVFNEELDAGPIGSIRASIRALESLSLEGLIVWPVDFPRVRAATVQELIHGLRRAEGSVIVLPRYGGRCGHPVIFGQQVFSELMGAPDSSGARFVVRKDETRVTRIDVTDSAVIDSVNTPADYEELLNREV